MKLATLTEIRIGLALAVVIVLAIFLMPAIANATVEFVLTLNKDINLTAIPLDDERIYRVSDLATLLEDDWLLIISYNDATYKFQSFALDTPETAMANVDIAGDTGLIIVMKNESILMLQGNGWPAGDVQLNKGINMIGIPLKDPALKRVSDLCKLLGGYCSLIISFNTEAGKFQSFTPTTPPGIPTDINIDGGVGLIVSMKDSRSFSVTGEPWERITPIPPITPPTREGTNIMDIHGSIFQKDGVRRAPNGLKVTVTNKTRSLSLFSETGDAGDGKYSVLFMDILGGIVASSGDEIEIIVVDVTGKEVGKAIHTLTGTEIEKRQAIIDVITTLGVSPGDVSGNGTVSAYDAAMVLQYVVGLITLTDTQIEAADVSKNGTVSAYDAALILQYVLGLITSFTEGK
jgi:hypothetical protein